MNLVIDSGNTKCKLALFQANQLVKKFLLKQLNTEAILARAAEYPEIEKVMLCNVSQAEPKLNEMLSAKYRFHELSANSKLPFTNLYQSPQTLGSDRVANVAGAVSTFQNQNCLVVDVGTCIKYDLVNSRGEYLGGSISPGISLRFKAMNNYTNRLPLLKGEKFPDSFLGTNTNLSMETGVFYGILGEMEKFIQQYLSNYKSLQVIMTGGDSHYFVPALKSNIFAIPNLTLMGLNKILELNA